MKKYILSLVIICTCLTSLHAEDNGLTPGNMRNLSPLIDAILRISSAAGPTGPAGPEGPASSGAGNSTFTKTMPWGGSVLYATNTVCPFPSACFWTGPTTYTVISIQGAIAFGSTVAMTSFDIVESTGGTPIIPAQTLPKRFPRIDVTTATAAGYTSFSIFIPTVVVIPANTWVGAQCSTVAASGALPRVFTLLLDVWKKPYGGL